MNPAPQLDHDASSPDRNFDYYLSLVNSLADSVGAACPPVGTPYRHRLKRLSARLSSQPDAQALSESSNEVRVQLAEFSQQAAAYIARHGQDLRTAMEEMLAMVRALSLKHDLHCGQLRQLSQQMDSIAYHSDPGRLPGVITTQAAVLRNCADNLCEDGQSLLNRMKAELAGAGHRIAAAENTDPLTGLINRIEMDRRIEAQRTLGCTPTLILITLNLGLPDDVILQVTSRLQTYFRQNDVIARWSGNEFLVLFRSTPERARSRAAQLLSHLPGQYLADDGEPVHVHATSGVTDYSTVRRL